MSFGRNCQKCRGYGLVSIKVKKGEKNGTNKLVKCSQCKGSGKVEKDNKKTQKGG